MDPPPPNLPFPPSQIQNPNPNLIIPPNSDLPTMISHLKDLVSFAESTLHSVSSLLPSSSLDLRRCPFDPQHRTPPDSLFHHSLTCPSAPGAALPDLAFLHTLRYPSSLKPASQLQAEKSTFARPLVESESDLCFSLDRELGQLGSNFFYRDCPGVVTTPDPDLSSRTTFTLPAVLSAECANFVSNTKGGGISWSSAPIFPSELLALKSEVNAWRDYPTSYSYAALQVASCLPVVEERGLKKWLVSNSPFYGILIDAAMGEHIFLLLKLCLKSIGSESRSSLELLLIKEGLLDPRSLRFECPRLVGSLTWLASQLSVLYGEVNCKFFTIGMLKESLLRTGPSLLVMLGQDKFGEDVGVNGEVCEFTKTKCTGGLELGKHLEGSRSCEVFVSQVAAAVAALHERFLLEEKIKVLRFARPLHKNQLLMEYSYASTRGVEERGKRPNYRAILEHDGLHWQRSQNQNQGKAKTREELLAEERDYKRRRMSYRGKKVKRTPTQVIRDIIEEHMDEIKQAGGIGCKLAADTAVLPLECNSRSEITADIHESQRSSYDPSERRSESSVYMKPLYTECTVTPTNQGDVSKNRSIKSLEVQSSHQKLRYSDSEHWEDRKRSNHESQKNYESSSPPRHRNNSHFREQYAHQKKREDMVDKCRTKYERTDSRSKNHNNRSSLTNNSGKEEYDFTSETRTKDRGRTSHSHKSDSMTQTTFEDRYDPSVSYDGHGASYDNVSTGASKFHTPNDSRYHDELQRSDRATKRHYQDHHKL